MRTFSKIAVGSFLLALGACGGGSSGGAGIAKIKGTWQPTTYLATVDCGANGSVSENVGSNVMWSMGTTSDLIQTDTSSNCVIHADVTGYTASAIAGQTCLIPNDGSGDSINISLSSYTFSLSADYQTAQESGSGSALVTFANGASATCVYQLQAAYHKIGT